MRALTRLGRLAQWRGDVAQAATFHTQARAAHREACHKEGTAASLVNLGHIALHEDQLPRAASLFAQSLTLIRELGDSLMTARGLAGMARLATASGQFERAARLFGGSQSLLSAVGRRLDPPEEATLDAALAAARSALNDGAFAMAWAEGEAMTPEQAIAYALEDTPESAEQTSRPA